MKLFLRAFALVVVTTFAQGAYAGNESQEIQGDQMKDAPANQPGGGTSDAASTKGEDAAIQGDQGKSDANKSGGGTSNAASPSAEDKAIQGDQGK